MNAWRKREALLDGAHGGVIIGLGNERIPFDVALVDAGAVVVRLAEPVTRRLALAVADAVLLASQCGAVTVIDAAGREVTL